MRGVVFKNLGQKFSSIIHTADLDSDSGSALRAASSLPPWRWEFRQAGKAEFGAPAGRDTAGTRQGHGSAVHPGRAQYYSRDPLCSSESALPFSKDTLHKLETRLLRKLQTSLPEFGAISTSTCQREVIQLSTGDTTCSPSLPPPNLIAYKHICLIMR